MPNAAETSPDPHAFVEHAHAEKQIDLGEVVMLEDPPLFSGGLAPLYRQSERQSSGPVLELFRRLLGEQWSIGDWASTPPVIEESM